MRLELLNQIPETPPRGGQRSFIEEDKLDEMVFDLYELTARRVRYCSRRRHSSLIVIINQKRIMVKSPSGAIMQNTLTIEYPDDLLFTLGVSDKEFSEEARLLLAAKLYELGKISSGQAARLAGKTRVEFLFSLSRLGVSTSNLREDDLPDELNFALND